MDFPEMIRNLGEADIPFKGVRGWILQGAHQQVVFMDIEPIGEVTEHTHGAQFGVVLEGEMQLTIDGVAGTYRKGDSYFIPEGAPHSAVFLSRVKVIDVFDDRARYHVKE